MEIHKPKPIHTWRELATEIGVIVVGILIALGLEQAVAAYHSRERTEVARQAILGELRFSLAKTMVFVEMQDCAARQMTALSNAVGRGDQAEVRRLILQSQLPHVFTWSDAAWQTALASDVSDHFTEAERRNFAILYNFVDVIQRHQDPYVSSAYRLRAIALSGLAKSSAAEAAELSEVAEQTATLGRLQELAEAYNRAATSLVGLKPTADDRNRLPFGDLPDKCRVVAAALGPPQASRP